MALLLVERVDLLVLDYKKIKKIVDGRSVCRFAWNFKTDAIQHLTSAPSLNVAMEAGSSGHNNNLPKMYMLPFVCDPYQKWEIETSKYRRGHCCEIGFPKVDMVPDLGHTRSHESGFWSPMILKFSSQQNRQTPVSEKSTLAVIFALCGPANCVAFSLFLLPTSCAVFPAQTQADRIPPILSVSRQTAMSDTAARGKFLQF